MNERSCLSSLLLPASLSSTNTATHRVRVEERHHFGLVVLHGQVTGSATILGLKQERGKTGRRREHRKDATNNCAKSAVVPKQHSGTTCGPARFHFGKPSTSRGESSTTTNLSYQQSLLLLTSIPPMPSHSQCGAGKCLGRAVGWLPRAPHCELRRTKIQTTQRINPPPSHTPPHTPTTHRTAHSLILTCGFTCPASAPPLSSASTASA
jgi:hypothetical protein